MAARIRLVVAVLLAVLAMFALLAAPASACCGASAADPDDVVGRLDIALVAWHKADASAPMRIVIKMHDPWKNRVLRDHVNRLVVDLDTDGDFDRNYKAVIRKTSNGKLIVLISGSGSNFEPLPATRPNARTVAFKIPGNSPPNPNGTGMHIRATSTFIENVMCDPASGHPPCVDRAPDGGAWV